jgi:hypothetical protein
MKSGENQLNPIFRFYYEGFRDMSPWGRKVWLIIIIKVVIIYAILKLFFFQDFLGKRFDNDIQRSEYVRNQILNQQNKND